MLSSYPNWVEVNLSAIEANTRLMVQRASVPVMVVVKADGYGHGAVPVAQAALASGAHMAAVARLNEAVRMREAGIHAPILVFGMTTASEVDQALARDLTLTLHNFESAEIFIERARAAGKKLPVHLKVDTGLGRLGLLPEDSYRLALMANASEWLDLQGIYSHMAMVDEEPHPLNDIQVDRFVTLLEQLSAAGVRPRWQHIGNTTGLTHYPRTHFNLLRVGCGIVGVKPLASDPFPTYLRRSLTWKVQLANCKLYPQGWGVSYGLDYITPQAEWIGLLPLGYADGFRRAPENQALVDGQRVPVVGRVCMDMCMIRLPQHYPMGTEVVLIGRQGSEEITPDELAERWHTTEVDVTGAIHFRVPRVYVRD